MVSTSASFLKASFNAGELSPLFGGRVDHVKYSHGLKRSQTAIPVVHGAVTRRPGTVLVGKPLKTSATSRRHARPILHDIAGDEVGSMPSVASRSASKCLEPRRELRFILIPILC